MADEVSEDVSKAGSVLRSALHPCSVTGTLEDVISHHFPSKISTFYKRSLISLLHKDKIILQLTYAIFLVTLQMSIKLSRNYHHFHQ